MIKKTIEFVFIIVITFSMPTHIWAASTAPVPESGQKTSYYNGDDGNKQAGVVWPKSRFSDNNNGTVTDNLTGLIWLKDANCAKGQKNWSDALSFANNIYDGWSGDGSGGDCGLSDTSVSGDWRLPNRRELFSLIDDSQYSPALPASNPFSNVQSSYYWSSTSDAYQGSGTLWGWRVDFDLGIQNTYEKSGVFYVWAVHN